MPSATTITATANVIIVSSIVAVKVMITVKAWTLDVVMVRVTVMVIISSAKTQVQSLQLLKKDHCENGGN